MKNAALPCEDKPHVIDMTGDARIDGEPYTRIKKSASITRILSYSCKMSMQRALICVRILFMWVLRVGSPPVPRGTMLGLLEVICSNLRLPNLDNTLLAPTSRYGVVSKVEVKADDLAMGMAIRSACFPICARVAWRLGNARILWGCSGMQDSFRGNRRS
jgi:hypothetical protein